MASDPSSLVPPPGPLYGAIFIGAILSTGFYGFTCMQTFIYFVDHQKDSLSMKLFVAALWALNTVYETLSISGTYKCFMSGLLNPLLVMGGASELVLLFTAIVATLCQGYLVHRICIFGRKNLVWPLMWIPLALLQLASAIIYVVKALYNLDSIYSPSAPASALNKESFTTVERLCFSVPAAVDTVIAILTTYILIRTRIITRNARTAYTLRRLIIISVNTGIWMASFALLTLVFMYVFPKNMLYTVPGIPICAVYCNTILANLNAREYIRHEDGSHRTQPINMDLLFTFRSLPVAESTGTVKRQGNLAAGASTQQDVWKTTEVKTFSDTDELMAPMAL